MAVVLTVVFPGAHDGGDVPLDGENAAARRAGIFENSLMYG